MGLPMGGFMKFYTMATVVNNMNNTTYNKRGQKVYVPSYTPVEDIPTASWIPMEHPYKGYECSNCGEKLFEWEDKSEYCPKCKHHMIKKPD